MAALLLLLLLATAPDAGVAVSNGLVYICNPSGNFGCSDWQGGHQPAHATRHTLGFKHPTSNRIWLAYGSLLSTVLSVG